MAKEADKTTDKPVVNGTAKPLSSMERAILMAMGENKVMGHVDDDAATKYPMLWEWLSKVYVGRDKLKTPASLSIRLGPDGALATLTDRDLGYSVEATSKTLEGLFDAIERQLRDNPSSLKAWGKKEANLRKRKSSS